MKFMHVTPRIRTNLRLPSCRTLGGSRLFCYKPSRSKQEAFEDLDVVVTKVRKKKSDKLNLPPSANDIRLIIEPNYTHMENANLPHDTYTQLLKELHNRFKKRTGNEFVVKHLSGGDYPIGWTSFFSDKTGRFPSGLVTDVTSLLFESNVSFDKIDRRPELDPEVLSDAIVTPDLFNDAPVPVKLRDYQVEIANIALRSQRGIIKCATGGGKTLIFASILKALKNRFPAVILFRNKQLVTQTHEVFQKCGLVNVGKITGDEQEPDLITCCTVQSVHKLPKPKDIKLLIADECHGFATPDSIKAIRSFENTLWRLGFSATPFKNDDVQNFKLKSWFGPQLCDITTSDLTTKSILAESTIHFYPINQPSWLESLGWPDAEEEGIVHNEYLHQSVATLVNKIEKGRILILVKRLNQGDQLVKLIPGAFWVKGEDNSETREYVLNQLRYNTQEKVVAIFSPIGYIGLDVFVHHIVNCTGGKEASLTIQQLGRGLRKAPDKESCDYHDFYHTTNKYLKEHSHARLQTLKKEGHNVIMEPSVL